MSGKAINHRRSTFPTPWLRWAACFVLVTAAHASAGVLLLRHVWTNESLSAGVPMMMVRVAVPPEAPNAPDLPPATVASEPQPEFSPPPEIEPKSAVKPAPPQLALAKPEAPATVAVLPPPRPVQHPAAKRKPLPARHASIAAAPPHADRNSARAAAPAEGPSEHDPNAMINWKSRLVAQIERHKRYPAEAEARGEHGVAQVAFSVDRHGGVHGARIVHSAGSSLLDRDALAWLARAAPLPPPPADMRGALVPIVVPLRYTFR